MTLDLNQNKHAATGPRSAPTPAPRFQRGHAAERHRSGRVAEGAKAFTDTSDTPTGIPRRDADDFEVSNDVVPAVPIEVERDLARTLSRMLVEQFRADAALPVLPGLDFDAVHTDDKNQVEGRPTRDRVSLMANHWREWSGLP